MILREREKKYAKIKYTLNTYNSKYPEETTVNFLLYIVSNFSMDPPKKI